MMREGVATLFNVMRRILPLVWSLERQGTVKNGLKSRS